MKEPDIEEADMVLEPPREADEKDQLDPISWAEHGYVHGRFGGIPVLITPKLAAQIVASRKTQR